jgi:hypothetical protein
MLISVWRKPRKNDPISSPGKALPKSRRPSFRPKLEALEDRTLPAAPGVLSGLQSSSSQPARPVANQMAITVMENAAATVIDLDPVLASKSGIHPEDGFHVSLLGNTNPGLVKTDLSDGELTLTYTRSQCGTADIEVCVTAASGVSVEETIAVTVLPLHPTVLGSSSPIPTSQHTSITLNSTSAA